MPVVASTGAWDGIPQLLFIGQATLDERGHELLVTNGRSENLDPLQYLQGAPLPSNACTLSQFHRTKCEYCKCTALSNQQSVSPETPDVHVQMTATIMGISFQGTKRARLMSHVSTEGGAMYNIKNT